MNEPHPSWKLIEPGVCKAPEQSDQYLPHEHEIELSKAISLKRIADALAPVGGADIGTTLFYLEQRLGEAINR